MSILIPLALIILLVIFVISTYNNIIAARNNTENAFAQIEVQLTRRYDLIPNLVEVAKKYLEHENQTLTQVTAARNQATAALQAFNQNPQAIQNLIQADSSLTKALAGLAITIEAYPELKADQQLTQLNNELTNTEDQISYARSNYNAAVTYYNNTTQTFPNNLFAKCFAFQPQQWLDIEAPEKREAIKIKW